MLVAQDNPRPDAAHNVSMRKELPQTKVLESNHSEMDFAMSGLMVGTHGLPTQSKLFEPGSTSGGLGAVGKLDCNGSDIHKIPAFGA